MHNSEMGKTYLSMFFGLLIVITIIYIASKEPKFSCDEWAKGFRDNFHCNIILTKKDYGGGIATFSGIDMKSKKNVECEDGSKWLIDNFEKFNIGDTVVKNQGQYTVTIKRKGKIIIIPFTCNSKVYTDK